jgi:hypothetical protein
MLAVVRKGARWVAEAKQDARPRGSTGSVTERRPAFHKGSGPAPAGTIRQAVTLPVGPSAARGASGHG